MGTAPSRWYIKKEQYAVLRPYPRRIMYFTYGASGGYYHVTLLYENLSAQAGRQAENLPGDSISYILASGLRLSTEQW